MQEEVESCSDARVEGGEYKGEVEDFISELVLHETLLTELNLHELA
jgi:hypothetical protein